MRHPGRSRHQQQEAKPSSRLRRGPGRPADGDKAKTRLEILEAAVETFAAEGYTGGQIRAIAERAGVTHGTVQHHFRSKRELFLLAHQHTAQRLVDGWEQALVNCDTLAEELDALLERSVQFLREQPAFTRLLLGALGDRSHPELRPLRFATGIEHFVDGIADRAIARGEVSSAGGEELRYLLRAMLWGLGVVGVDNEKARVASIVGFRRLLAGNLGRLGGGEHSSSPSSRTKRSKPPRSV